MSDKIYISNEFSIRHDVLNFRCMVCYNLTTLIISGSFITTYKIVCCDHCLAKHINPVYLGDRIS